jgi:hypothetical protein
LATFALDIDGDPAETLRLADTIGSGGGKGGRKGRGKGDGRDLVKLVQILRAEALLAQGKYDEASALVPPPGDDENHMIDVKRRATMRHIRRLLKEPEHLDYALEQLENLTLATPSLVLDPDYNVLRIDLRLARGELKQAFHLGNRIQALALNEVNRPKIMGKQVEALAAVGMLKEAKGVLAKLQKAYPYSTSAALALAAVEGAEK